MTTDCADDRATEFSKGNFIFNLYENSLKQFLPVEYNCSNLSGRKLCFIDHLKILNQALFKRTQHKDKNLISKTWEINDSRIIPARLKD